MKFRPLRFAIPAICFAATLAAQPGPLPGGFPGPFPGGGPGRGPGGFGGVQEDRKLVKQFDKDGDQRLNAAERQAARELLAKEPRRGPFGSAPRGGPPTPMGGPGGPPPPGGFGRGGFGRGPFGGEDQPPPQPGPKLTPKDVKKYGKQPLYDPSVLRTLFIEFENTDWEKELADFFRTDVEVPAKLSVDGKKYPDIGVHFRGMSSFMMVREGRKRSLNLALDFVHDKQRLSGYRTLNLLNSHGDPTFLRGVLYLQIARTYIPAPKANYMRVVINGESWGIYVNAQQFNSDFIKEWFGTTAGARWKVPGSPGGRGGLAYLGDDPAPYKRIYEIKSKDDPKSWVGLIQLCKILAETPPDQLEAALDPVLNIDGVLKFLALEKALINSDGYWTRASDYNIYQDIKGKFHIIPHDANETLRTSAGPMGFGPGGPGGRGGPGGLTGGPRGPGIELDPFAGADDPNKALLHKLMAVPSLRARYLAYVRDIAEKWLDWNKMGPLAAQYQSLIAADVKSDTRKLHSTEAFLSGVAEDNVEPGLGRSGAPPGMSLKAFVEKRRTYLLSYKDTLPLTEPRL